MKQLVDLPYRDIQTHWEEIYQEHVNIWAKYPAEEVIRFMARHYGPLPDHSKIRVLDLGCGPGANTWYLCREGYTVDGVDCSTVALQKAERYLEAEGLKATLTLAPLQSLPFDDETFACVIDNVSTTHNTWEDVLTISDEIYRVLRPGGKYYGAVFGPSTSIIGVEKEPGFFELTGGVIKAVAVRLFQEAEVHAFLKRFQEVTVDHQVRTLNQQTQRAEYWHYIATKPNQ